MTLMSNTVFIVSSGQLNNTKTTFDFNDVLVNVEITIN